MGWARRASAPQRGMVARLRAVRVIALPDRVSATYGETRSRRRRAAAVPASPGAPMSLSEHDAIVAYCRMLNARDVGQLVPLLADDFVYESQVVLATVAGDRIARLDVCVIPRPQEAERSGAYPGEGGDAAGYRGGSCGRLPRCARR